MQAGLELAGRYRLTGPLGRGGMGEVWRGIDARLGRTVAVKILPLAVGADSTAVARFRREAEIAATLTHPGITTVFDIDEHPLSDQTLLFLVMELMQGHDLHNVMTQHPSGLPIDQVTDLAGQILDALSAAHKQGVVHRDIKPANLFLLDTGQLKICDFGIARLADATRLTATGAIAGTPLYMAPEQIEGRDVDQRTDLYAVGCVLYELLTGRPWVDTTSGVGAILYQHIGQPPAPPKSLRPDIPDHLDALVVDLLAKHPDQRPHDAVTAATRLSDALAGNGPAFQRTAPALRVEAEMRRTADVSADTPPPKTVPPPKTAPPRGAVDARPLSAGPVRSTWWAIAAAATSLVIGGVVVVINHSGGNHSGSDSTEFYPLKSGEARSGQQFTIGQQAAIPYFVDSKRTTVGITITAIDQNIGQITGPDGGRPYCIRFHVTNLGKITLPSGLLLGNGTSKIDFDAPYLEGVTQNGGLTDESNGQAESTSCNTPGSGAAPDESFDQTQLVFAPSGTPAPVTSVQLTVHPSANSTAANSTYTVVWK